MHFEEPPLVAPSSGTLAVTLALPLDITSNLQYHLPSLHLHVASILPTCSAMQCAAHTTTAQRESSRVDAPTCLTDYCNR
jgi:hypothetical protein